jgi:hypothetical protein
MRSRADAVRAGLEWVLHGAAVAVLAWFLVHSIRAQRHGAVEDAASASLPRQLPRWSTVSSPERVHVALEHPPAGRERDWLAALAGAGTGVTWSGPKLVPTAVAIEPRADPARGADVSVAAPEGATVVLSDTLGVLDSARGTRTGVRGYLPKPRSAVDAVVGPVDARAARHDSLELKRLFVVGEAGWEGKFTVAALEERGWAVDAHLTVSPKGDVHQGRLAALDTAHYSAVLALDTTAARYAERIASFVKQGGGLVLWSSAARARGLAAIAPGMPGAIVEDEGDTPPDSAPRSVLELAPITSLAPDAVVLERRGAAVTLAARRVGPGRVVETGYTNSWRWRTAGGSDAPERHRDWIAGLVAGVAYAPHHPLAAPPSDAAPLASLVDRLGPASTIETVASIDPAVVARWVFGFLCAALLLEWASRRLRGVK